MNHSRVLFILTLFFISSLSLNAQDKQIYFNQLDSRFSLSGNRYWSSLGEWESYHIFVENLTGDEYLVEIEITMNKACIGIQNFFLRDYYNGRTITLKPYEKWSSADDHAGVLTSSGGKNCRIKDNDSYTLLKGISYKIVHVKNITQQKKEEELQKKRLQEEAQKKRLEEEAIKKRLEEEAQKKRLQEEAQKKRLEEEAQKKRLEEEAQKKKLEEEPQKKKTNQEVTNKQLEEETQKKKLEEDAQKKKLQEETQKKKLEEEAEKKRSEEEAQKKKLEEEKIKMAEKKKADPEEERLELLRIQAENNANQLNREGDALYNMGPLFRKQALEKYKAAYVWVPWPWIKKKIDEIENEFKLAEGLMAIAGLIEDEIEKIDPQKKTRFMFFESKYSGYNLVKSTTPIVGALNPKYASIGFIGHRSYLSLGVKFGYLVTPVTEYEIERQIGSNELILTETFPVQQQWINVGMSLGFNIPIRNIIFSALYTYEIGFIQLSEKTFSSSYVKSVRNDYKFIGGLADINSYALGFQHVFPQKGIGYGIYYNLSKMNGEEESFHEITSKRTPNSDYRYTLRNTTQEKYDMSSISISLYIFPKVERKK